MMAQSNPNLTLLTTLASLLGQQAGTKQQKKVKYCSATCPDPQCRTKLYFPAHEASVECSNCGQRHTVSNLPDKQQLKDRDKEAQFGVELTQLRQMYSSGKKTSELVRVNGISNYQCKLLSPLLTTYGRDSKSDCAKPLKELGLGEIFDCSKLASRAFAIESSLLNTMGYGRDRSGSTKYLSDTLKQLQVANGNRECLVPIHADGDGHCLVHAISRCLVGRELFWHALRSNLHHHFTTNEDRYKEMFKDFYSSEDWPDIIAEAAPDFQPPDGQQFGLRNIHIFGLANVLRRPILLLDSLSGMQSSGDYSGFFLPTLHAPHECCTKDPSGATVPNSPIVVAWSSSGRNHFIPLVPIKGQPLPKLPAGIRPKVWGQPEELLLEYVTLDATGCIELCGGKALGDSYLQKLMSCMQGLFYKKNSVVPSLVADVNQYVYKSAGCVGVLPETVTAATKSAIEESRLYRCLICSAISCVPAEWLKRGGQLYTKAAERFDLENGLQCSFPLDGISATYIAVMDSFVPFSVSCFWCVNTTRPVQGDGTLIYENGDRTSTRAYGSRCGCGYKHYWDGKEYDNLPEKIPLSLTWGNRPKQVNAYWFQYESDPTTNSNVYEVAQKVVNDNYPGEFGSERLVQQVVDLILAATAQKENMEQVTGHHPTQPYKTEQQQPVAMDTTVNEEQMAQKFIITGQKSKTLHKEELTVSETERQIKKRVEDNARLHQQRKRSTPTTKKEETSPLSRAPYGPKVSPPPPSSPGKPALKKIRVTTSDGKTANLSLQPSVSFSELQAAIEKELSIPPARQRLRSGYPPKELRPSSNDPSLPVKLANGERVSVDIIAPIGRHEAEPEGMAVDASTSSSKAGPSTQAQQSINTLLKQVLGEVDLWTIAQHQPQLFTKGGDYYQQVLQTYGGRLKDNTHFQFKEFTNKTFAYSAQNERLEVCLGLEHVPVGPLTPQQEQLAHAASVMSTQQSQKTSQQTQEHGADGAVMGGGVVNRPLEPNVRAFSGQGHTLGEATSASGSQDPLLEAAQLVVQKRLVMLQSRERELQTQVRSINRQLVHAEANKDGASVRDDVLTSLETKLLDSSAELKKVREEIRELTTLQ